jgi:hypothetical protein
MYFSSVCQIFFFLFPYKYKTTAEAKKKTKKSFGGSIEEN